MNDKPSTFRGCIIRAFTIRSHVSLGLYRQASTEIEALRHDLSSLPACPPFVRSADPREVADALVGHGEAGNPFGMLLETMELESLVGRIVADMDESREQTTVTP